MGADVRSLRGATAVVAGGSRGIGRAVTSALTDAGVRTIAIARDPYALDEVASSTGCTAIAADLADAAAVNRVVEEVRGHFGTPDVVVNAAGTFMLAPAADTALERFDTVFATNVRAPFALIRAFVPDMLQRRSGHIVSIGSIAGRSAFAGNAAYGSAKFALRGLHAVLDAELRGTGVRTTLIEPAATDTTLWDDIDRAANPGLPEPAAMLKPGAVAEAVMFALTRAPDVAIRNIILEHS